MGRSIPGRLVPKVHKTFLGLLLLAKIADKTFLFRIFEIEFTPALMKKFLVLSSLGL